MACHLDCLACRLECLKVIGEIASNAAKATHKGRTRVSSRASYGCAPSTQSNLPHRTHRSVHQEKLAEEPKIPGGLA